MDRASGVDWSRFKPTLQALYLEQDLSLAEVMQEMATKYHLVATSVIIESPLPHNINAKSEKEIAV
jgi:hypothetical protein